MRTLLFRDAEQIENILKMGVGYEEKLTVRRGSKWNTDLDKELNISLEGSFTTKIFGNITVYSKLLQPEETELPFPASNLLPRKTHEKLP